MRVSLSPEALDDARLVADWYTDQAALAVSIAFRDEVSKAVARLAATPGLGTRGRHGVRILPIHRFPFSLVYRVHGDVVRVIAVAAQRRRPGYWARRL